MCSMLESTKGTHHRISRALAFILSRSKVFVGGRWEGVPLLRGVTSAPSLSTNTFTSCPPDHRVRPVLIAHWTSLDS